MLCEEMGRGKYVFLLLCNWEGANECKYFYEESNIIRFMEEFSLIQ